MQRILAVFGVTVLASALATGAANAQTYTDIIDPANPTFTQALGINGSGTIVGYGNATTFNGFQLTLPSNFTRENNPTQAGGTQVTGIDAAGNTVGFSVDGAGTNNGFYKPAGGGFVIVNQSGSVFNQLLGINQNGTEAAGYSSFTDPAGATGQQAFAVTIPGQTYTNINALLPTNINSQATGVNNAGAIVGFYQLSSGNFSAFADTAGTILSFQVPGAVSTQALGINNKGWIVGDYTTAFGNIFGFVDVGGVFTTLDPNSSNNVVANGINDAGRVVGFYASNTTENTIGFYTDVPEPAAFMIFGVGLAGLTALRRKTADWRHVAPGHEGSSQGS